MIAVYAKPHVRLLDPTIATSSCTPSNVDTPASDPCRYRGYDLYVSPKYSEVAGIGFCYPTNSSVFPAFSVTLNL